MPTIASMTRKGWGNPTTASFRRDNIQTIELSDGTKLTVHKSVAFIFLCFLNDIISRGYTINRGGIPDDWGWVVRKITGGSSYSLHSWGVAVDINALTNPYARKLITDMPPWVLEVAKRYRLRWGGTYSGTKDAMHFEWIGTRAEADKFTEELVRDINSLPTTQEDDDMINGFDKSPEDVARATIRELCEKHWGEGKMTVADQNWLLGEWKKNGREVMMTLLLDHPKDPK